jgi:hypothetical protein
MLTPAAAMRLMAAALFVALSPVVVYQTYWGSDIDHHGHVDVLGDCDGTDERQRQRGEYRDRANGEEPSRREDFDALVNAVVRIGAELQA